MKTAIDPLARARELHRWIAEGRVLEAFDEFYAPDVRMQENTDEPCRGHAANRRREEEFLASVKDWKGFEVVCLAAADEVTFAETVSDYVLSDGTAVHTEQVARAVWRDGKIVDERFYHS